MKISGTTMPMIFYLQSIGNFHNGSNLGRAETPGIGKKRERRKGWGGGVVLILAWCGDNGKRGRECYIICGIQCKVKMWGLLLKIIKNFKTIKSTKPHAGPF